jgi:hypothetical protein
MIGVVTLVEVRDQRAKTVLLGKISHAATYSIPK